MRTLLLALLLLPATAWGQAITDGWGTLSTGPRILGEPSFAFELDALEQAETSRPGWPVTTTRASTCMALDAGSWKTQLANVACIGAGGLESYGSFTNNWVNSANPSLHRLGGSTITGPDADGWYLVEDIATGSADGITTAGISVLSGETWTLTCDFEAGTASLVQFNLFGVNGTATCTTPTGCVIDGTTDQACRFTASAHSGKTRISCSETFTASGTVSAVVSPAPSSAVGSFRTRQCQLTKTATPGPRHDCGATACTRAADVHVVNASAWPAVFDFRARIIMPTAPTGSSGVRVILDSSGASTQSGAYFRINNNTLALSVYSAAVATDGMASGALAWVDGAEYEVRATNAGGVIRVFRDGVEVATKATAVQVATHAAVTYLGGRGTISQLNGSMKIIRVAP